MNRLNAQEMEALDKLADGLHGILSLLGSDPCHPDDLKELTPHVHAIQNLIMARAAVRDQPNTFTHLTSFCGSDRGVVGICHADHAGPLFVSMPIPIAR